MKQSGAIIITTPQGETQHPTAQCAHCGNHFVIVKGSGIQRGYCLACNAVTCGGQQCINHLPFEKKLDLIESRNMPLIIL